MEDVTSRDAGGDAATSTLCRSSAWKEVGNLGITCHYVYLGKGLGAIAASYWVLATFED